MTFRKNNPAFPFQSLSTIANDTINLLEGQIVDALDGDKGGNYSPSVAINVGNMGIQDLAVHFTMVTLTAPFANELHAMGSDHRLYITLAVAGGVSPVGSSLTVTMEPDIGLVEREIYINSVPAGFTLFVQGVSEATAWTRYFPKALSGVRIAMRRTTSGNSYAFAGLWAAPESVEQYESAPDLIDASGSVRSAGYFETAVASPYLATRSKTTIFHTSMASTALIGGIFSVVLFDEYIGKRVDVVFAAGLSIVILAFRHAPTGTAISTGMVASLPPVAVIPLGGTSEVTPVTYSFQQTSETGWMQIDTQVAKRPKSRVDYLFADVSVTNAIVASQSFFVYAGIHHLVTLDQWHIAEITAGGSPYTMDIRVPANYSHDELVVQILSFDRVSTSAGNNGPTFNLRDDATNALLATEQLQPRRHVEATISGPAYEMGSNGVLTIRWLRVNGLWTCSGITL